MSDETLAHAYSESPEPLVRAAYEVVLYCEPRDDSVPEPEEIERALIEVDGVVEAKVRRP